MFSLENFSNFIRLSGMVNFILHYLNACKVDSLSKEGQIRFKIFRTKCEGIRNKYRNTVFFSKK